MLAYASPPHPLAGSCGLSSRESWATEIMDFLSPLIVFIQPSVWEGEKMIFGKMCKWTYHLFLSALALLCCQLQVEWWRKEHVSQLSSSIYWLHSVFRSSVNILGFGFLLRSAPFNISLSITSVKLKLKVILDSGALTQLVKICHHVAVKT